MLAAAAAASLIIASNPFGSTQEGVTDQLQDAKDLFALAWGAGPPATSAPSPTVQHHILQPPPSGGIPRVPISRAGNATVIIMADSRRLRDSANSSAYFNWAWAAALNMRYACKYGYDFRIYSYRESLKDRIKLTSYSKAHNQSQTGLNSANKVMIGCYYDTDRKYGRAVSWCKLAAVADALEMGYGTVVYLDSDAFLTSRAGKSVNIETLVSDFSEPEIGQPQFFTGSNGPTSAWFASNKPWGDSEPNAGLQIWRNTKAAKTCLQHWWNFRTMPFEHAYEQDALSLLAQFNPECKFGVLDKLHWMEPSEMQTLPGTSCCCSHFRCPYHPSLQGIP
jgi:hypothetical protein